MQDCLVGIVTLDPDYVPMWAKQNGLSGSIEELAKNQKLIDAVLADIKRLAALDKLNGFEIVKGVHLEAVPWTPDDVLTPTFKLKRAPCQEKYQKEIDALYAEIVAKKAKL